MTDKPHLSPTQMDMFCRCPEAYRRRYIEGEKLPPGIALLKGSALHAGAETNMRQKIETHADLPIKEIVGASVAAFELQCAGGFQLAEDEAGNPDVVLGRAKDDVVDMAECHAEAQAPDYQPVMVERPVLLALPGPYDLMGVIDLADDRQRVTDFKTAGRSKRQSDADDSVQLTTYAAAYHALTGQPPAEVRLDTVVKTKTKVSRQLLVSTRGERDMQALANRINSIGAAIQAGVFTPAPPGSWWCSTRFCGYASTCPYVNSERKAAEGNGD